MPYNNSNAYGKLFIDSIRTPFLDIGEIDDAPSDGGSICSVLIPGYLPTLKLTPKVEIYDYNNDLAAIGNVKIDSVKTGNKPKTSFQVISYNKHLSRKRVVGQFSNTLLELLRTLISEGNASAFFTSINFRTSPEVPSIVVSRYIDFKYLKDAIPEVLSQTGKVLDYAVPVNDRAIEIIEPGYGGLAPIAKVRIDDFYINKKVGISNTTYTPIGKLASVVRFFGHNGREYFNSYLGKGKEVPLLTLAMRAQDGKNNYPLPETADEIILIRITTPEPQGCTVVAVASGDNYTQYNQLFSADFILPNNPSEPVTLTYTATIQNIKSTSSACFYFFANLGDTIGHITISFNGNILYDEDLTEDNSSNNFDNPITVSLADYVNQSGDVIVDITLDEQINFTTDYEVLMDVNCCKIDTIIGNGNDGFSPDGTSPLSCNLRTRDFRAGVRSYNGEIIFADSNNMRVRKLDSSSNTIVTIGGNGSSGTTTDGQPALSQPLGNITHIDLVGDELFLFLRDRPEIGKINLVTGVYNKIFTSTDFANLDITFSAAFPAIEGMIVDPTDLSIYFTHNHLNESLLRAYSVIYKITSGVATLYAGQLDGDYEPIGDGGDRLDAGIYQAYALALDSNNNLIFSDVNRPNGISTYSLVRKINKTTGIVNTIAGDVSGFGSLEFDIDASNFFLFGFGTNLTVDKSTNDLYIASDDSVLILKVKATTNIISHFAGNKLSAAFCGDGGSPMIAGIGRGGNITGAIHFVSADEFLILDAYNRRIRKVFCT